MELHILIVDDSPAMRTFIRRVLDLSGLALASCLEASDGEAALRILGANRVDVVLTDINMPRMDGEELLRHMFADQKLRPIPVVVISTDRTDCRVHRMLGLGARGYVGKPFAPETLRHELERCLGVLHDAE